MSLIAPRHARVKTPPHWTLTQLWNLPEEENAELIHGKLTHKAMPSGKHGRTQLRIGIALGDPFDCPPGSAEKPGGWWLANEVDMQLGKNGVCPDIAGWRREHLPKLPNTRPIKVRPDWVCEILSPSNPQHDQVVKLALYHQYRIPHYWIVDTERQILTVYRWLEAGYLTALTASAEQTVHAEPFEAIAFSMEKLFTDQ